ncbi:uncharacterized protein LOC143291071 isoform X1 [Babylonia areolata]|uniref:uncharacterized protein LOC143291071 isoform X1 n=1 Tax=Babylonia areolata TaxID=304850 RepID=UPI003FCEEECF
MKLICFAFLLGLVACEDPGYLTIDFLRGRVDDLLGGLSGIFDELSDTKTLCAAADDKLNYIHDFFIPYINKVNEQQYELIASYEAQEKALQHRVDDAKSEEKQLLSLAEDTKNWLNDQYDALHEIAKKDKEQDMRHDNLTKVALYIKENFLDKLNDTLEHLHEKEDATEDKIDYLNGVVYDRKCEYGFLFLEGETTRKVYFKSFFKYAPEVSAAITGFSAHLDGYSHGDYDVLSLKKMVTDVDPEFFEITSTDESKGPLVKYVSVSWMACQRFDEGVDLPHEDVSKPK